ncbi:uncharacterized protein V2V93DRAFT_376440 [Kockiozyma suomiensis]|uniref:uncharacterized protein n=1 Tax=Kockiozyma suomiensis TaxID=1337062 RepID=UPI00334392DB
MNNYPFEEFLMSGEGSHDFFAQQQQQQQQQPIIASSISPADMLAVPQQSRTTSLSFADSESDNEEDFSKKRAAKTFRPVKDIPSDDDERLLASEEGKKLSSKERRQLRNKVSARHFRLRRKEYITHLEQLIEQQSSEANGLKAENERLALENKRLTEALQGLSLSPAPTCSPVSYLSPSPSEEVYTPSMSQQQQTVGHTSLSDLVEFDFLNVPLGSHPAMALFPTTIDSHSVSSSSSSSSSSTSTQQSLQQAPTTQRITPRIANLLPTFNTRKDTNPNSIDWPLAYSMSATDSQASNSGSSNPIIGNMQVFNTLVPESLAELEKEALRAQQERENMERVEREQETARTTITVDLLLPKPDKEDEADNEQQQGPRSREGIWEDACKAAEEVYKRLGLHLAGLSLNEDATKAVDE